MKRDFKKHLNYIMRDSKEYLQRLGGKVTIFKFEIHADEESWELRTKLQDLVGSDPIDDSIVYKMGLKAAIRGMEEEGSLASDYDEIQKKEHKRGHVLGE